MIIIGWGKNSKKIVDAGFLHCKNCDNISIFEVRELTKSVSVFFIPVAKWNKKTYLVCQTCNAGYELSNEDKELILKDSVSQPNNDLCIDIHNDIDNAFIKFKRQKKDFDKWMLDAFVKSTKKLKEWEEFAKEELMLKRYKEDDIDYVLANYNLNLITTIKKTFEKYNK